jgi:AraC family transcriptional regulator
MEERAWVRPDRSGKMAFTLRATSEGRSWTGFDAQIYDTSGGFAEASPKAYHSIVMQIGQPMNASCRCDGLVQRRYATPGDIDILPSAYGAVWEEDGPTTMLTIHMTRSLVSQAAQDMGLDPDRVSVAAQLQLRDPKIEHIGWALKAELQADELYGSLYADSLGFALASRLLQRYAPVAPPQFGRSFSKRRLRKVIDYIHDNLALDLSLADLAGIAGLSITHFKSLFREATSMPVHQYVVQCRVEYAANLLAHGKSNLSEVASQAGFSDQSHMARCMRRVIGVTPNTVKRQHE